MKDAIRKTAAFKALRNQAREALAAYADGADFDFTIAWLLSAKSFSQFQLSKYNRGYYNDERQDQFYSNVIQRQKIRIKAKTISQPVCNSRHNQSREAKHRYQFCTIPLRKIPSLLALARTCSTISIESIDLFRRTHPKYNSYHQQDQHINIVCIRHNGVSKFYSWTVIQFDSFYSWRRGRDSNPRTREGQRFSRPPRSTTPPPLLNFADTLYHIVPAEILSMLTM